jgi:hypothetical protein
VRGDPSCSPSPRVVSPEAPKQSRQAEAWNQPRLSHLDAFKGERYPPGTTSIGRSYLCGDELRMAPLIGLCRNDHPRLLAVGGQGADGRVT